MTSAAANPAPRIEAGRDRLGETACGRVAQAHLLPYQIAWVEDRSRVRLWEKSRRIGADYCEAYGSVRDRLLGLTDEDYWYSSADESAAVEQAEYSKFFLGLLDVAYKYSEGEDLDLPGAKVMTITLPKVGRKAPRLTFMTSSPKRFRSKGGDVCLSEFAFHKQADEMWKAASPSAMWGGRISVISTHNGENSEFNLLVRQARRRLDPAVYGEPRSTDLAAAVHRTTIYDAIDQGLVQKINETRGCELTEEQFLEDTRRMSGSQDRFDEECGCIPSAQSSSYFPTVLLRPCVNAAAAHPTSALGMFLADIAKRADACSALAAGCDVGRKKDRFTIWVDGKMGLTQRLTCGILVYHEQKFSEMETAINALMTADFAGKRVRRICIDTTGLGMQLGERMADRHRGRVEQVTMTTGTKEDMFTRARVAFEDRTLLLPDSDRVLADWSMIRRIKTAGLHDRYDAEANEHGHADLATAGALALVADESGTSPMRAVQVVGGLIG